MSRIRVERDENGDYVSRIYSDNNIEAGFEIEEEYDKNCGITYKVTIYLDYESIAVFKGIETPREACIKARLYISGAIKELSKVLNVDVKFK